MIGVAIGLLNVLNTQIAESKAEYTRFCINQWKVGKRAPEQKQYLQGKWASQFLPEREKILDETKYIKARYE